MTELSEQTNNRCGFCQNNYTCLRGVCSSNRCTYERDERNRIVAFIRMYPGQPWAYYADAIERCDYLKAEWEGVDE